MLTRDQIADIVRGNLDDAGITYYTATDINDALQDGYDDVAVVSGCIQKNTALNFTANLSYYDFQNLISDYYAVVAIYNNVTKRWMDADSLKSFDNIRRDWELWVGNPAFFSPVDQRYVVIVPRQTVTSGTFQVYYRATAPVLSGSTTPLVHEGEQTLLEWYATGDLLDQAQEYVKADVWWTKYFEGVSKYKARIHNLALSDYLPTLTLR